MSADALFDADNDSTDDIPEPGESLVVEEDKEEESDKEEEEEKQEDKTENTEESEEAEEQEERPHVPGRVLIDSIKAKYPDLFKQFPDLRSSIMRGYAYLDVFPDIQSAKEAAEDAENFRLFEAEIVAGNPTSLLDSIREVGTSNYQRFCDNFLPSVFTSDPQMFARLVTPVINNAIANMHSEAVRTKDDNLRKAALYIARFYTGEAKPPSVTKMKLEENEEAKKLKDQQTQFEQGRFESYRNEVVDEVSAALREMVSSSLKGIKTTDFIRNGIVRSVMEEVSERLRNDANHLNVMKRIWESAKRDGYKSNPKPRIRSAYLGRVRTMVPSIVTRLITEAGLSSGRSDGKEDKRSFPGTGKPKSSGKPVSARDVDWTKASTKDVLFGDSLPLK